MRSLARGCLGLLLLGWVPACSDDGGAEGGDGADSGLASADSSAATTAGDGDDGVETGESAASESDGPKLDVDDTSDATSGGTAGETGGDDCDSEIIATIRDHRSTHPDFEAFWGTNAFTGLVLPQLGADQTPQYNPSPVAPPGYNGSPVQITSGDSFAQWYHDVPDVNVAVEVTLALEETSPGVFTYDNQSFFPVDGMGFNDETFPDTMNEQHNFHFTTEVHLEFEYKAGQVFSFTGDDDLWLFIDGQLVIDLGGLHGALSDTIELDSLGLTEGETYTFDLFHAERRHDASTFRVDTSIDCFVPAPID